MSSQSDDGQNRLTISSTKAKTQEAGQTAGTEDRANKASLEGRANRRHRRRSKQAHGWNKGIEFETRRWSPLDTAEYVMMVARWSGVCAKCYSPFEKGTVIKLVPEGHRHEGTYHLDCIEGIELVDENQLELEL